MSINKVILVGNVGKPAEIRTVGDQKVASFTLATTEKYKGKDGKPVESTEWHNIVIWGKLADVVEKYVQKGTQLYIDGKIKTERYTDKNGVEKNATKIVANTMQLLGGRQQEQSQPAQQPQQPTYQNNYGSTPIEAGADEGDDLPF